MSEEKDSRRVAILHACEHHAVVGEEDGTIRVLSAATEGSALPSGTHVVSFEDRDEPGFMNMKTLYRTPGPSKANSRQYRAGWDAIFGKKQTRPEGLN